MPSTTPGVFRRLTGMAYEFLLLTGIIALLFILPHILIGALTRHLAGPWLLWAHLFLLLLVYFTWFWTHGGQTLAMKTWRIQVTGKNGEPLRAQQALRRFLWCWPSLFLGGAGILWALFDREHQFLHDRLAGTRLSEKK